MIGVRVSNARDARHYLTAAPPADDEPLGEVIAPEREPLVAVQARATIVDWDPHQGETGRMVVLNIGDVGQLSATLAAKRIDAGEAERA